MNKPTAALIAVGSAGVLASCTSHPRAAAQMPPVPAAMAQTLGVQVLNAINAGDGDYQTRALRKRVLTEPANPKARLELAERYRKAGAPELALEHYRVAASLAPSDPDAAMLLARTLRDLGEAPEAIAELVGFCSRNQNPSPQLLSLLGVLRDDAGQFIEGEHTYRAALDHHPDLAYLHNNLGYNLLLQGKPGDAAEEFERALRLDPHSEFAHNNLGLALISQWKDDTQAKEALLHWQAVSDPATAHNNLATVLIEQSRFAEARQELKIALSYRNEHPAALANWALLAELDGRPATPARSKDAFWKRVRTVFTKQQTKQQTRTAESAKKQSLGRDENL